LVLYFARKALFIENSFHCQCWAAQLKLLAEKE